MKGKRFLLMLIVAIVSQGAWAQGSQYVQELTVGENLVNIPSFSTEYRYSTDRSAYNLYKFETPYSGSFGIYATGVSFLDKAFAMFDENGNYVKDSYSMGNGYTSPELEGHKTYYLGMRAKEANKSQKDKYLVEYQCEQHDHEYGEDGICTHEGCSKKEPVLHLGLNEDVDCSYESDPYRFVPTKSGKLTVIARDANGNEAYRFYYTLKDENGVTLYTNYVASAPMRKAAGNNGCSVEADKTYFLDFSQNHSGTYNIVLEVEEELPPVELNDTQSNEVSFPVGYEQLSGFKYTVKEKGGLTVSIDTNAEIVYADIIPWDEWLQIQDEMNGDSPASAPRKAAGVSGNESLVLSKVVDPGEYAIFIVTTTNEETSAEISLNLTTEGATTLSLGDNWIEIAGDDNEDWNEESEDAYTLFPFIPAKDGVLTVESIGNQDTMGALFDADGNFIKSGDDEGEDYNFKFSAIVEGGKNYNIGIREYDGEPLPLYLINVSLNELQQIDKTLELFSEEEGEIALGNALENYWGEDKWEDLFSVNGVTYKRNATTSKWGTVVLPYQLESNEKVAYYELTTVDLPNGILEFTKVDFVKPNTPTVYRIIEGNQYDASVSGQVLIEIPQEWGYIWGPTKANDWSMEGWYYDTTIDTQNYKSEVMYISGDKFWHATGTLHMKPYRAYFYTFNWPADAAKAMNISFKDDGYVTTIDSVIDENGEFTDVTAIYDVNGRQLNNFQRGVNIIRTANGKIRKFIK